MYPLRFKNLLVEKNWGGQNMADILKINLPENKNIGESWEVSCHKNGMSIVDNGEFKDISLEVLLKKFGSQLVGDEIYKKYGEKFPLLIKYLDIQDRLSVQVHPNDEYAQKNEGEFGKSECWYIINASKDAKLILGIKDGLTKEVFEEKVKNKDFSNLFNEVPVKKGDCINITPGLVHASLSGSVLICEIQQNSDITYRIYDFDRIVDGKLRPLHLDKALDVIDFTNRPDISSESERSSELKFGGMIQKLIKGQYFNIDKLVVNGTFEDDTHKNFKIYSILDGVGTIESQNFKGEVKKGETYFIPANLKITIKGTKLEILKSYI